jgi:hypothetical protein|nr:MAG TPA: hypothetical protein [Caudoviricetes sp.]
MRLDDLLSYISENENVYVWLDGKIVAEYNGRDSIFLKYNDFEVEKGSLRKYENGIEVTLTGNLIVSKR